jgi:hypothetical protein
MKQMEYIDFLLLFISVIYLIVVVFFYNLSINKYIDKLNPVAMLSLFSALDAISLIWFAVYPDHREALIYSQIYSTEHKTITVVLLSYLISIVGYLCMASTLFILLPRKYFHLNLKIETMQNKNYYGLVFWLIGILLTFNSVIDFGGVHELWFVYVLQGREPDGIGYVHLISHGFICIGGAILYQNFYKLKKYLAIFLMLGVSIFFLAIFGRRSPVLLFIMMILFTHNYKIKKIKNLFTGITLAVGSFFLLLALFLVSLRPSSDTYLIGDNTTIGFKIAGDLIMRVGTLERKMVVIGYFNLDNLWFGQSYYSIISAPIPRSIFIEKPVVDTGIYIKDIAENGTTVVNRDVALLPATSWPDGNLAGWMNFHFIGFIFLTIFSGIIYGGFYRYMRNKEFNFSYIYIYSTLCYWGAPNLSPMGIVRILSIVVLVFLVYAFTCVFFRKRSII